MNESGVVGAHELVDDAGVHGPRIGRHVKTSWSADDAGRSEDSSSPYMFQIDRIQRHHVHRRIIRGKPMRLPWAASSSALPESCHLSGQLKSVVCTSSFSCLPLLRKKDRWGA